MSVLRIEGTGPQVMQELDRIRTLDQEAEGKKSMGCVGIVIGLLVAVAVPMAGGVAASDTALAISVGIGAAITIGSIVFWTHWNRFDYENSRQEAVRRIHQCLMQDVDPKTSFTYEIDFRAQDHRQFHLRTDPVQKKSAGFMASKKIRTSHYRQPVVTIKARLCDGTRLAASLLRRSRVRNITKSKPGKTKYRTQKSHRDLVAITAQVPPQRYGNLPQLQQRLQNQSPPSGQVARVAIEGQIVKATLSQPVSYSDQVNGEPLLEGLVWLFRGLRQEKAQALKP
ncbi:MAG: hypothetical protein AB7S38_36180 [Vulcanimicrobiota bacterium]